MDKESCAKWLKFWHGDCIDLLPWRQNCKLVVMETKALQTVEMETACCISRLSRIQPLYFHETIKLYRLVTMETTVKTCFHGNKNTWYHGANRFADSCYRYQKLCRMIVILIWRLLYRLVAMETKMQTGCHGAKSSADCWQGNRMLYKQVVKNTTIL